MQAACQGSATTSEDTTLKRGTKAKAQTVIPLGRCCRQHRPWEAQRDRQHTAQTGVRQPTQLPITPRKRPENNSERRRLARSQPEQGAGVQLYSSAAALAPKLYRQCADESQHYQNARRRRSTRCTTGSLCLGGCLISNAVSIYASLTGASLQQRIASNTPTRVHQLTAQFRCQMALRPINFYTLASVYNLPYTSLAASFVACGRL